MQIQFFVPDKPVAKARARMGRNGVFHTPRKTVEFENKVGFYFLGSARGIWPSLDDVTGPLRIVVESVFPIPKSWSAAKKAELAGTYKLTTPDGDNLLKAVCDGLNGVAYHDDSIVVIKHVIKGWQYRDEPCGTHVLLESVSGKRARRHERNNEEQSDRQAVKAPVNGINTNDSNGSVELPWDLQAGGTGA